MNALLRPPVGVIGHQRWRLRRTPPPNELLLFGVCTAVAPSVKTRAAALTLDQTLPGIY